MWWREILTWAIVLPFIPLNGAYWWAVVSRWQDRFRERCEQTFGVTIAPGARGHWKVSGGSWLRNVGIEWLQFLYFVAAMVVWSLATFVVVGGLMLLNE